MPTMNIPGIGPVEKKWVYAGVAVTAGIVGYAWWRNGQSNADDSASALDDTTDTTDATDGTISADAYGTDYSSTADPGAYYYGADNGATDYLPPTSNYTGGFTYPVSNQEWDQKALEMLSGVGIDSMAASSALGRYLGHLSLDASQADIVRQALGMLGPPPQGSFSVITTTTPPTGGGGGTTTPPASTTPSKVSGLHATKVTKTAMILDWNPAKHAYGYTMYADGHRKVTVTYSQGMLSYLKPNHRYRITVRPVDVHGKLGPSSTASTVYVTTKKK